MSQQIKKRSFSNFSIFLYLFMNQWHLLLFSFHGLSIFWGKLNRLFLAVNQNIIKMKLQLMYCNIYSLLRVSRKIIQTNFITTNPNACTVFTLNCCYFWIPDKNLTSNFILTSWLGIDFRSFQFRACNRGHWVVDGLRKLLKPQQRNITISMNKPCSCKLDLSF